MNQLYDLGMNVNAYWLTCSQELRMGLLFILGLVIGSFLNVVIYRLPLMLEQMWQFDDDTHDIPSYHKKFNLCYPRSHCPACKANIPNWANIPILGYILLRGKCYTCHMPIAKMYMIVELFTAIIFMLAGIPNQSMIVLLAILIFNSLSIILIMIDWTTLILPDELTGLLLWSGIGFNLHGMIAGSLENSVLGAMLGYLLFWSISGIFKSITSRDGMGRGDFKFLAAILAWVGYTNIVNIVLVSSILGIIYFISINILSGKFIKANTLRLLQTKIPFGPFLGITGIGYILMYKLLI